jgi:hypothetical protein
MRSLRQPGRRHGRERDLAEDPRQTLHEACPGSRCEQRYPVHLLAGRNLVELLRESFARDRVPRNPARRPLRRRDDVKLVFVHADGMPEDGCSFVNPLSGRELR